MHARFPKRSPPPKPDIAVVYLAPRHLSGGGVGRTSSSITVFLLPAVNSSLSYLVNNIANDFMHMVKEGKSNKTYQSKDDTNQMVIS
jgi:hypothetical protein